jgi:hypothetical protein
MILGCNWSVVINYLVAYPLFDLLTQVNETPKHKDLDKPEPDEQMIEELVAMGFSRHGAYRSVEACKNAGVQEALEYAFQHSSDSNFNDPPASLQQDDSKKKKKKPRLIPLELQHLFTRMQCLDCATISTQDLTSKGFQWQGMDGRVQHDAHELNRCANLPPLSSSQYRRRLLIDALEKSLKNLTPIGGRLCQDLYQG